MVKHTKDKKKKLIIKVWELLQRILKVPQSIHWSWFS